ncbi:tetraprenyl-beta-curcumene synthase family protein [Ornithinibacillus halophilus]|uniref:Tetraprenyl-beta-curcumene synthase n=1 Tax=Ornithinibacillus halophilus TaxID=930117 RepID=A0A1M5NDA1_9BACI|nr:tetraprenyl-beta-curcumene synthase family protein [Ornithinibacillus halophilus]SHG86953.1 tetraprenyl-beta-curcumene synthase [Ornithinibacillus halophilus]
MDKIPTNSAALLNNMYRKIFPQVNKEVSYWERRANEIPDNELRNQALASIQSKRFHCQGGSVFSMLAGDSWKKAIKFIVAYQTISDYLDNLCDRSTSMDPADFRLLHDAMKDALSMESVPKNYYRLRENQEDGGYLLELVSTCQEVMRDLLDYSAVKSRLIQLEEMYTDLQVHKHVVIEDRVPRLTSWYERYKEEVPDLSWYEFSAAAGSTLGIFCIISYALGGKLSMNLVDRIYQSYFPYMQCLHILLDYFIDQQEDDEEGDLNFCFYYPNETIMRKRFLYVMQEAASSIKGLPDQKFHQMIYQGLIGLYLTDSKVNQLKNGEVLTNLLLDHSGRSAKIFYWNIKMYNRWKK